MRSLWKIKGGLVSNISNVVHFSLIDKVSFENSAFGFLGEHILFRELIQFSQIPPFLAPVRIDSSLYLNDLTIFIYFWLNVSLRTNWWKSHFYFSARNVRNLSPHFKIIKTQDFPALNVILISRIYGAILEFIH